MKTLVRLLYAIALSGTIMSTAVAAEGKVVSVFNTDTYTYVEISRNDQNSWIVGPLVVVKPSDQVHYEEGAVMTDFYSDQLRRKFPAVMFVQEITVAAEKQTTPLPGN